MGSEEYKLKYYDLRLSNKMHYNNYSTNHFVLQQEEQCLCVGCGAVSETAEHLFFVCDLFSKVWQLYYG